MLMHTRGAAIGRCNICGDFSRLTEDHTPPKGVLRVKRVQLHHITQRLSPDASPTRWRNFQNGVTYRTVCGPCNNGLGLYDDPALIEFSTLVYDAMRSLGRQRSMCKIRPQNVMRSVIGHLSAQGVDRYAKGPTTENIAWYLTDRRLTLPTSVRVYWWPYPFSHQVLARDCAFLDIPSGHVTMMWIMKFFPLAFAVVLNCPKDLNFFGVTELSAYRDCLDGEVQRIEVDCTAITDQHWPEAPADNSVLAYGPEAAFGHEIKM